MKRFLLVAVAGLLTSCVYSQTIIHRDAEIENMVKQISADSLHSYINSIVNFGTRSTISTQKEKVKGIGAARNWVLAKFNSFAKNSNGRLTAFIDTTTILPNNNRLDAPTVLGNVMATLKGTDEGDKRIYIISGHLDSRRTDVMDKTGDAPGANDDGSGVAAVLECARIMSQHSFPATIIFVAVSGEEQGLLGSTFLAAKARKENWNVDAVLNNDIMGSNNSSETNIINNTKLRVFSEGLPSYKLDSSAKLIRFMGWENDGKARQLARYVKETGERYVDNLQVVMIYRNDRFLRGGDHTPFVDNGFAAIRLTEMNENFEHQHQDIRTENGIRYGDLAEFMDFEYLRKNTGVNLASLANLAKAPSEPQDVKVDVKDLTNFTSLTWKAPLTGKVKGYYVVMRETTSAVWERKFFTEATQMRLPYSKDNYFFGVQAVSEEGNESLVIVPQVGR